MGFLPAALRPAWSGASFLLYAGAFTVLGALSVLLGSLAEMHGSTALIGWSALFLALLLAVAVAADRDGRLVVAGLSAFVAVAVAGVVAGSLLDAIGLADGAEPFDRDLELAPFVIEVVVLAGALAAARRFRFPLLLLAATIATTVLVLDATAAVFGTGNWIATVALLLGLVELAIARSFDASDHTGWAFWKHTAAALTIGGGRPLVPRRQRRRLGRRRAALARLPRARPFVRAVGLGDRGSAWAAADDVPFRRRV